MKHERLFTPIQVNGLELKNRVLMPALNNLYTPDGYATDRFNQYYWRRAEGGIGLIIVGGCRFDKYGGSYHMPSLADDSFIPGYKAFTDGIHERGAKVGVQLFHAGRYAQPSANDGLTPLAPSAVYSGYSRATPEELTVDEIHGIQREWADAAVRAKKAGFDLVEILASAGYLICQFLSPLTNLRTDEYGGSWENRTRFARETVAAIRQAVGPDYPLSMRIAGNDLVPGSNTTDDAVNFAKDMEKAGIDLLNVTGGWHESKVPQITGDLPRGGFDFIAAAVKDAVSIPVACGNRINDPKAAERILALGCADMVSLGRPSIADPDWCRKAQAGDDDLIRRCLGCNQGCLANSFFNKPVECLVNGRAGREYELKDLPLPKEKKKILVIGGGPAGCEFAIQAASRGHSVELWEKSDRLGGQVNLAAVPPGKQEFFTLVDYFRSMLKRLNVNVIYNREATKTKLAGADYDVIVTACGRGKAKQIPLDIDDSVEVLSYIDILTGEKEAGRNVIVVGGGTVGCETALYMAREGSISADQLHHILTYGYMPVDRTLKLMNSSRRKVTVVDIIKVGKGFKAGTGWVGMGDLKRMGASIDSFASTQYIRDGQAVIDVKKSKDSEETERVTVPVDTVVMAVGAYPSDGLYKELEQAGLPVYNLGDATGIGDVQSAITGADKLAEELTGQGF